MITYIYSLNQSGLSTVQILCFVLAYAIAVLFALSMHEFAHAFAAYKSGDATAKVYGRLTLNPFKHLDPWGSIAFLFVGFGWAKPVPINPIKFRNYKKNLFFVSLAGIIANLTLAIVCSFIAFWCSRIAAMNNFYLFLYFLFTYSTLINICLAVFNLFPIYPLDGFNALSAYLKYDNKFVNFMRQYGQIILFALILTGLFSNAYGFLVDGALNGLFSLWGLIFG